MAVPLLPTHSGGAACPVCGGTECAPAPTVDHLANYPFLPGGIDPLSTRRHVIAPHRIVDHELGRVAYGTGDRVPWADAVKYGLVPADEKDEKPKRRAKKGPVEDRARKPGEDR